MAVVPARLGRWCFRRRRTVAALWIGLLVVAGVGAATLSGPTQDAFSVPGTEAQRANDLVMERFPAAGDGAQARVVLAGSPDERELRGVVQRIEGLPEVAGVAEPLVSPDGRVAVLEVAYGVPADDLADRDREALRDAARASGLRAELSGDAVAPPAEGGGELVGVGIAAIVLTVTLGSLTAAGLPLLTAIIGIGVGLSAVITASGFLRLNSDTPALALMLGLAVAIDYALFIISRYRDEALGGREPEDAAGHAVGTAGSAVVFAGLTVVIALSGLAVVGIPVLTELGVAAALTVAVAVLVALTLLPALIGFAGHRVLGRRRARGGTGRWGRFVTAHPVPVLAAAVAALAVAAVPALDLRLGLPDDGTAPPDTTQRQAYDLVADAFGPGFNGPLTLVVRAPDAETAGRRVVRTVEPLGNVAAASPVALDPAGRTALVRVVPGSGPTSEASEDLIGTIRDRMDRLRADTGIRVAVTGQTAIDIDTSGKLADAMGRYLLLVVGLAFLLLMLLFRSVLVPLKATAGFLLSIAATFGAVVAVFQWGWLNGPLGVHASGVIVNLLPVMMIGMVFGLAMDYQVFLVTRMREEHVRGAAPIPAVVGGLAHGSRVVTAAALIMISVFAGFVLSPLPMLQSFGFALAIAVFFDAFIVRMTIVPALMALLGHRVWWLPQWLDHALPRVDAEGSTLPRHKRHKPGRVGEVDGAGDPAETGTGGIGGTSGAGGTGKPGGTDESAAGKPGAPGGTGRVSGTDESGDSGAGGAGGNGKPGGTDESGKPGTPCGAGEAGRRGGVGEASEGSRSGAQ